MPRSFQSKHRNHSTRSLRMEDLERRIVLTSEVAMEPAAVAFEAPLHDSAEVRDPLVLDAIVVRVNRDEIRLRPDDLLHLNRGDVVQVIRIDYAAHERLDGVLAAEGYIHKLAPEGQSAGAFDYADGRFGVGEAIALGDGSHTGLDGQWVVEEGWSRLALTVVRYFGDDANVEGVIHVRMQVGEPDFRIDESFVEAVRNTSFEVGKPVNFSGLWDNSGAGRFHNYMEIDVVDVTEDEVYEWVGVLVGNASQESPVAGVVDNQNANDPFAAVWTPAKPGQYLIILAVDPEDLWEESDESNNLLRLAVEVRDPADQVDLPPQRTLVFSASFEDTKVKEGRSKFVKRTDGFRVRGHRKAELQHHVASVGRASDGDVLLELDSTRNVSIYRDFDTRPGEKFTLELDYSPRPGIAAASNTIEVVFQGQVIASLSREGRGLTETAFETVALDLPAAVASQATLELRGAGKSDGFGGLIDHVRMYSSGLDVQEASDTVSDARGQSKLPRTTFLSDKDQQCFVNEVKTRVLDGLRTRMSTEAVAQLLPRMGNLAWSEVCELADSHGLNIEQEMRDFDVATAFRSSQDWWSSDEGDARWWDAFWER